MVSLHLRIAMQIGINFVAALVGVGGFLLGYDVGIISGVLAMDSFKAVLEWKRQLKRKLPLLYSPV